MPTELGCVEWSPGSGRRRQAAGPGCRAQRYVSVRVGAGPSAH